MNRIIAILVGLVALTAASTVHAFPHLYMWSDPANGQPGGNPSLAPGAGLLYGTGGAKERGITCALCHIKAPGTIGATVTPSVPWQVIGNGNGYKPGMQYTITVTMTGETKNPGTVDNLNGFALTIENAAGNGVGTFATDQNPAVTTANCTNTRVLGAAETNLVTAGVTTYMISPSNAGGGCYTVVSVPKLGATSWTFKWTAPAMGSGPVTIYYGVVDGDHGGTDSKGDDVKQGTIKLVEGP